MSSDLAADAGGRLATDAAGTPEANKDIARRFVAAWNDRDLAAIDALLADDFVWHVAVAGENETELRPFQSNALRGQRLPILGLRTGKQETLAFFKVLFENGADERHRFRLRLVSVMAEGDRVAFEAEGDLLNPANGRHYQNIYFILLRISDGKIVLYKEYQDTLHIYDVVMAD
jgi:ketosteroid isomerase-like protein